MIWGQGKTSRYSERLKTCGANARNFLSVYYFSLRSNNTFGSPLFPLFDVLPLYIAVRLSGKLTLVNLDEEHIDGNNGDSDHAKDDGDDPSLGFHLVNLLFPLCRHQKTWSTSDIFAFQPDNLILSDVKKRFSEFT